MKKFLGALLDAGPVVMRDLSGLGGVLSATVGAWQIYRPAGFIVGGLFLIAGAWLLARSSEEK